MISHWENCGVCHGIWHGECLRSDCPNVGQPLPFPRLQVSVQDENEQLKAQVTKLEHQLIDLRHRHQTLEDETKWCEGDVRIAGMGWAMRWRGQLFIGPVETCFVHPIATQIQEDGS